MNFKNEYYDKAKQNMPNKLLLKFFKDKNSPKVRAALDIGCGAGNDTCFLLKKRSKCRGY